MFKVTDVRVQRETDSDAPSIYIDGLFQRGRVTDPFRGALMLAVFNTGRACYWNSTDEIFTTVPVKHNLDKSPIKKGEISDWDVTIPVNGEIDYFVTLLSDEQRERTSGDPANGWATITTNEERTAFVVLEILNSTYSYYDQGGLRNTDIDILS